MRRIAPLIFGLSLAATALGQVGPVPTGPANAAAPVPELGKLFRSRLAGIEFNPPADGAIVRELNSGEVVRFVYADTGWDLRAKQITSSKSLQLSAPITNDGLLEITANSLKAANDTALILRQDVIKVNGQDVGLIEARYTAGTDFIFVQQAIFKDIFDRDNKHFLTLQMNSRCNAVLQKTNQPDALVTNARHSFASVLETVKIADRSLFFDEQQHRQYHTAELWVQIDKKKIIAAMQPEHFMRVIRSGKDVGYIQMNERLATRDGQEGIEVIVNSRVENEHTAVAPGPVNPAQGADGIVVPDPTAPAAPQANAKKPAETNLFTNSVYFVAFDRSHEDWTGITQTDREVATQLVETGTSDRSVRTDARLEKLALKNPPAKGQQPVDVHIPHYTLDVTYARGHEQHKPADFELPPYYLPQALGQMLPRLLPYDRSQYMFAFYVSGQQNQVYRYVDVESARDVTLDGHSVHAIPITDRIGADGIPTVHYVTRDGEWLGSVNEDQNLVVLPTDAGSLTEIWKNRPLVFKVATDPAISPDKQYIPGTLVPITSPDRQVFGQSPNGR